MSYRYRIWTTSVVCLLIAEATPARADRPVPLGTNFMSISYPTASGTVTFGGVRDYSGIGITDAQNFPGAANIGGFNAVNLLGRRSAATLNDPAAQSADETLMRHGIYKVNPSGAIDVASPFFDGLDPTGNITFRLENMQFDRPVTILEDTFLLHALWWPDQSDALQDRAYDSPHNHHIAAPFRNLDAFFGPAGPFENNPVPDYAPFDGIAPTIIQVAPDTLTVEIEFPYALLQHFQDDGAGVPPGLPGPGGFLEPFHFHLEYLVVPEPSAAALGIIAGWLVTARRRRR